MMKKLLAGSLEAAVRDDLVLLLEKIARLDGCDRAVRDSIWQIRSVMERKLSGERPRLRYRLDVFMQWPLRAYRTRAMQPTLILHADAKEMLFMYGFVVEPIVRASDHHIVLFWQIGGLGDGSVHEREVKYANVPEYTPLAEAMRRLDFKAEGISIRVEGGIEGETPINYSADFPAPEVVHAPGGPLSIEDALEQQDAERGRRLGQYRMPAPDSCDVCGHPFARDAYLVDGAIDGSMTWGDMCLRCAAVRGGGIGWGVGQLYRKQEDDSWLLVAGFEPDEEEYPDEFE